MPGIPAQPPPLQLPRPQTRVTQPQTHTRGKSKNPRTLYFQFELRKASSEQELPTPCASAPPRAGSGRQVLLTGDVPESTQRHQLRPQQHQECPRHSPGLARANPILCMSWPEPSSAGLPAAALRSRCLPDLCEEKQGFGARKEGLFLPSLHPGHLHTARKVLSELFHFFKLKHKGFGVRKAGNRLGCTF